MRSTKRPLVLLAAALVLTSSGCSVRRLAVGALANALAEGTSSFASDEDPDLVGDALPFALKTIEMLLAELPDDPRLNLAAAKGFTQYAYGWVASEAEVVAETDWQRAEAMRQRALRLYQRGQRYGLHALDPSGRLGSALSADPSQATSLDAPVEALYWTAAAWGSAISLGKDRPELLADLPVVRALLDRALALDPDWGEGALHEALIPLEALPAAMGGSLERARRSFERAEALAGGRRASVYVSLAENVAVQEQDRRAFLALLEQALAVEVERAPEHRVANELSRRRAEWLRSRVDDLILDDLLEEPGEDQGGDDG